MCMLLFSGSDSYPITQQISSSYAKGYNPQRAKINILNELISH